MKYEQRHIERFFDRFVPVPESGCWLWDAATDTNGYGQLSLNKTKVIKTHRMSYEIHNGPVPDGLHVLHKCDIRCCVNPDHLYVGTHQQNMKDRDRKHPARGERHPKARLRESDVLNIRAIYKHGPKVTYQRLAEIYKVSTGCIYNAIHHSWKHLNETA